MDSPKPPQESSSGFKVSDELQALLALWESKVQRGEDVTIADLCPDDSALADQLQRCVWAAHASENGGKRALTGEWPKSIGPYRVISVLGRGGSSTVYRAEQSSPTREVALKLFYSQMTSPRMESRFRLETQLLATLHHPGIAQIYDAGIVEVESRPSAFFTMELIDGTNALNHVNQKRSEGDWSAEDTVRLSLGFCDALAHAHEHRIVHRDLKPGNMLVTNDGHPKVIDFGIARLQPDQDADSSTVTSNLLVGTRPYMSPEQFGDNPGLVDARSDVYGLAVVIYQLLVGRLPYDVHDKSLWETGTIVRDQPSVPIGKVDRRLRGDLEIVLQTALAKEPSERYSSMREFADDLRNYCEGKPIRARRQTAAAAFARTARRHPMATTLSSLAIVSLVTLTALAFYSAHVASKKKRELVIANDDIKQKIVELEASERETAMANQVLETTTETLRHSAVNSRLLRSFDLAGSQPAYVRMALDDEELFPPELRNVAWKLTRNKTRRQVDQFTVDGHSLLDIAISDDGTWIVTNGSEGLRVWTLPDHEQIASIQSIMDSPETKISIDSDARRVFYVYRESKKVERLDLDTKLRTPLPTAQLGRPRAIVPIIGTDSYLVGDEQGRLEYWSSPEGPCQWTVELADTALIGVTVSEDKQIAGVVSAGGDAMLCRLRDGEVVTRQKLPLHNLARGRFSPDLSTVAASRKADLMVIWDFDKGEVIRTMANRGFYPDADFLTRDRFGTTHAFVLSGRREVHGWSRDRRQTKFYSAHEVDEVKQRKEELKAGVKALPYFEADPLVVDATADGTLVAMGMRGGDVRIYLANPPELSDAWRTERPSVNRLAFSNSGKYLAASYGGGWVTLFDAETGKSRATFAHKGGVRQLHFSPDDGVLMAVNLRGKMGRCRVPSGEPIPEIHLPPEIRCIDTAGIHIEVGLDGEHVRRIQALTPDVLRAVPLSPNFVPLTRICRASNSGDAIGFTKETVVMWRDVEGNGSAAKIPIVNQRDRFDPSRDVERIAIGPNGKVLAAGYATGRIEIRSLPDFELVATGRANAAKVGGIEFLPDGKTMVSAHFDGQLIFWDTKTWEPQLVIPTGIDIVRAMVLSPDGNQLALSGSGPEVKVFRW